MPQYAGRTNQAANTINFYGLNVKSSIINGKNGEATTADNWDVDLSGAITRRLGYATQYTLSDGHFFDSFFKLDGTQVYVAVDGGNLYEAASPAGPWTNRGGSLTGGDWTYIGTSLNGQYVLCNGIDKPLVFIPGSSVQTLEDASLLSPPSGLDIIPFGGLATVYQYAVTALTPRGETVGSAVGGTIFGPATLSATTYNTLTWVPPAGAFSQNIYRYNATANLFYKIGSTTGTAVSYVDTGATEDIYTTPPAANTAYNTPEDWNTNGQPEGVFVIARGKNQKMLAWRKSYWWASAISNIYDWYTSNDSFSGYNLGGLNNNIKAVTTLYDYTIMFSATNAFVYSGSTYSDFILSKILNTGCVSHYGITFVGDQGILWSQFGPSTIDRILSGQDVSTTSVGQKISPIVYEQTNMDKWSRIRSWHDIQRQRVIFAVPGVGQIRNTLCLAYNYQTKSWTTFSGWEIENTAYDPLLKVNYALLGNHQIVLLHSGNLDGATRVDNSYKTIYYDANTWTKHRLVFLDVMMDPTHPYELDVTVNTDFEDLTVPVQTYHLSFNGTSATTDGQAVVMRGDKLIMHRLVINGYVRHASLTFEDTASSYPARVVGFRFDNRVYGVR